VNLTRVNYELSSATFAPWLIALSMNCPSQRFLLFVARSTSFKFISVHVVMLFNRAAHDFPLLGCIECMRCGLLLLMIAVSVCQSVCHATLGGRAVCAESFSAAFAKSLWPVVLINDTVA